MMKRPLIIAVLLAMVIALVGSALVSGFSAVGASGESTSSVAVTAYGMFDKLAVT